MALAYSIVVINRPSNTVRLQCWQNKRFTPFHPEMNKRKKKHRRISNLLTTHEIRDMKECVLQQPGVTVRVCAGALSTTFEHQSISGVGLWVQTVCKADFVSVRQPWRPHIWHSNTPRRVMKEQVDIILCIWHSIQQFMFTHAILCVCEMVRSHCVTSATIGYCI